jgi:DNA-binding transcriptional MocR family regulator
MPLRNSLAKWQRQKGIQAAGDHVLVVSGSQQGLYLVTKAFVEPRDYVMVESPTYLGAIQVLESAGARLLCLPNSKKIDLQAMEDYLIRYRPKLFYTIPTFRNPNGQTMTLHERTELIRLAAKYRLVVVEDDPYGAMWYGQQPPHALKSLDTYGGVIYIGTFSKMLFPGLRTGWVTASPTVINRLAQEKQYVDLHSNNLAQKLLHTFVEKGVLQSHLDKVRVEYRKRRDAMASGLRRWCSGSLSYEVPDGGLYIWCNVKSGAAPHELLRQAAAAKFTFVPGEAFYPNGAGQKELRLCFSTHNEERLTEGVRRLGKILSSSGGAGQFEDKTAGRPII